MKITVIAVSLMVGLLALPAIAHAQHLVPAGMTHASRSSPEPFKFFEQESSRHVVTRHMLGGAIIGAAAGAGVTLLEAMQGEHCVSGQCVGSDKHWLRNAGLGLAVGAFWGAVIGFTSVNNR